MADIRDRLRQQIGAQGPRGVLSGEAAKALEDKLRGASAGQTAEERRAALYSPVDVYFVADATGSMDYLLTSVRKGASAIGTELFNNPDKGEIRMGISVVRDHKDPLYFEQGVLRNTHRELEADISAIRCFGGDDLPEAYECAWLDLARNIPTLSGQRKRVVVFAGDAIPHGLLGNAQSGVRVSNYYDNGCPSNVDYRTAWRALTTAANLTLFVGCHRDTYTNETEMERAQRSIVDATKADQKYIPLAQIGDISALVMAATRIVQSPTAAREYIARLQLEDRGRATRIAGYFGVGK